MLHPVRNIDKLVALLRIVEDAREHNEVEVSKYQRHIIAIYNAAKPQLPADIGAECMAIAVLSYEMIDVPALKIVEVIPGCPN